MCRLNLAHFLFPVVPNHFYETFANSCMPTKLEENRYEKRMVDLFQFKSTQKDASCAFFVNK